MIHRGDCLEVLDSIPESSLDACITDPPYHLTSIVKRFGKQGSAPAKGDVYNRSARGFMGQEWDGGDIAFRPETWAKVLRVLKPGAYIAAFSGTQTYHRMACAMEDAGFECIDMVEWLYAQGFSKAGKTKKEKAVADLNGKGRALKPAHEPLALMRKPREGTFLNNYAKYGTGYMDIEGMTVPLEDGDSVPETVSGPFDWVPGSSKQGTKKIGKRYDAGRKPANVVHDGSPEILAEFPHTKSGKGDQDGLMHPKTESNIPSLGKYNLQENVPLIGDEGSAARFFFCAKPSKAEKESGLDDLPVGMNPNRIEGAIGSRCGMASTLAHGQNTDRRNIHPTVKPISLMRWLVRGLVPQGGTLIDPFLGSGTTAIAAILENRFWIGCEKDEHYANIAQARIEHWADKHIGGFLS